MPSGIVRAALSLVLLVAVAVAVAAPASAAPACRQQLLEDWSDNGRIDRVYPLGCYENAAASLPPEIRDYSDAQEVIDRALTLAVRKQSDSQANVRPALGQPVARTSDGAGSTAVPNALLVLGGLGLGALVAGVGAFALARATSGRRGASR